MRSTSFSEGLQHRSPPADQLRARWPSRPSLQDEMALTRSTTEPSLPHRHTTKAAMSRKPTSKLRLPSFEKLGIAVPHPDRVRSKTPAAVDPVVESAPTQTPIGPLSANLPRCDPARRSVHFSAQHCLPQVTCPLLLTPPDDSGSIEWTPAFTAPTSSPMPSAILPRDIPPSIKAVTPDPGESSQIGQPASQIHDLSLGRSSTIPSGPPTARAQQVNAGEQSWLGSALELVGKRSAHLAKSSPFANGIPASRSGHLDLHGNATRVLAQTLPRSVDHRRLKSLPTSAAEQAPYMPSTAIIPVLDAIKQQSSELDRTSYIHITYAVDSPEVNLGYLPSSPPLTSGGFLQGGSNSPGYFNGAFGNGSNPSSPGYFSPRVFNSVVHVIPPTKTKLSAAPSDLTNWDAWMEQQRFAPLPSPNPVVPPETQHISILERYIPPTSPEDDQMIFSNSSSILVDRLSELSPGGTLLFVYPTKRGAETFSRDYLGPTIQPLLRGLMTLFQLPIWFCELVEKMRAVEFMKDFDALKHQVDNVCTRSQLRAPGFDPSPGSSPVQDIHSPGVQLIHSSTSNVRLQPEVWQEWWAQQEKARVNNIVRKLTEIGFSIPQELLCGELERTIINGVHPLPVPNGRQSTPRPAADPLEPIEVGVFVLQKLG
ncbi:MAG: hypothetical protein M1837_000189 [Sclerophora amabilis]|nr:MAG: hypothetical protein M1837_000189 [Sclerophora amabilis]